MFSEEKKGCFIIDRLAKMGNVRSLFYSDRILKNSGRIIFEESLSNNIERQRLDGMMDVGTAVRRMIARASRLRGNTESDLGGKSGLLRARWWVTPTARYSGRDSATENRPPRWEFRLSGVRVKRRGKSSPAGRVTGLARQTPPGARPNKGAACRRRKVRRHGSARSGTTSG